MKSILFSVLVLSSIYPQIRLTPVRPERNVVPREKYASPHHGGHFQDHPTLPFAQQDLGNKMNRSQNNITPERSVHDYEDRWELRD